MFSVGKEAKAAVAETLGKGHPGEFSGCLAGCLQLWVKKIKNLSAFDIELRTDELRTVVLKEDRCKVVSIVLRIVGGKRGWHMIWVWEFGEGVLVLKKEFSSQLRQIEKMSSIWPPFPRVAVPTSQARFAQCSKVQEGHCV